MWWLAIKTFFNEKVMSTTGIFIGIFALIIAVFIYSNSDVILSKFGFETTANLKSEVTRLQGELKQAKEINDKLNADLAAQTTRHKAELAAVVETYKEREKVKDKIIEVKTKKELKDRDTINKLKTKMVVTPTKITIPLEEYNQLSASNIDSINEVFNSFFPELKETQ